MRLNYQRQLAEYEQRLADREFQVTRLQEKLNNIENQIASLSVVKAPYSDTVRRIKWKGLAPDESLSAEITLMVSNSDRLSSDLNVGNGEQVKNYFHTW